MNPSPKLRPTPEDRLANGVRKAQALLDELARWSSQGDMWVDHVVSSDGSAIEAVVRLTSTPDISTYAFEFGEALFHLRSSLDILAFERAVKSGKGVSNPRQISFPICNTAKSWRDRRGALRAIPRVELQRWEALQPFNYPSPEESVLSILDRVHNLDKHRLPLVPLPLPGLAGGPQFRVGELIKDSRVDPTGVVIDFMDASELRDGEILMRYSFGRRVTLVSGANARVTDLAWFIADPPHGRVDLATFVQALAEYLPWALAYLRYGGDPPPCPVLPHTQGRDGQLQVLHRPATDSSRALDT